MYYMAIIFKTEKTRYKRRDVLLLDFFKLFVIPF